MVEGAGAAGLAAVMSYRERFAGRRVGLILCGGNIDLRLLSVVILRGLVHSKRLISLQVGMPDAPGNLAKAAALIGEAGGNILEVEHQRAFSPLSIKSTGVNFIIETRNAAHAERGGDRPARRGLRGPHPAGRRRRRLLSRPRTEVRAFTSALRPCAIVPEREVSQVAAQGSPRLLWSFPMAGRSPPRPALPPGAAGIARMRAIFPVCQAAARLRDPCAALRDRSLRALARALCGCDGW